MIKELSLKKYPKNVVMDIDGDWYDTNKYIREAFIKGYKLGLKNKKNDKRKRNNNL